MSANVMVEFDLKTHSARSLQDLVEKSPEDTKKKMSSCALGAYLQLAQDFNDGRNVIEIDTKNGTEKYIDIFNEVAAAKPRQRISIEITEQLANQIRKSTGTINLPIIFTSSYYLYDRFLDGEKEGKILVTREPDISPGL